MPSPAFTLTGNISNLIGSATGYLKISLVNPNAFASPIKVAGQTLINQLTYTTTPGTSFSITIFGLDVIFPNNCIFKVEAFNAGNTLAWVAYYNDFVGSGTQDLSTLTAMNQPTFTAPNFTTANANTFYGGPTSGGAGVPTMRDIIDADLLAASSAILGNLPSTAQTVKGQLNLTNTNGVTIYADQMTGADNSAKIQAAIGVLSALSRVGGTVDGSALPDEASLSGGSTTIDPGTLAVRLLLPPGTTKIKQIVLEPNFKIIGFGMGNASASTKDSILLTTNSSFDAMILTTVNQPVQGVVLEGFRLHAVPGNSAQKGLSITALAALGFWYSTIRNVAIGATGPGLDHFRGGNMYFNSPAANANSVNQFLNFENIQSFRDSATGHCLDIIGNAGQFVFNQCQFDGPGLDAGTNVYIADTTGGFPNTITFLGCTTQFGGLGFSLNGSYNVTIYGLHTEALGGFAELTPGMNDNINFSVMNSALIDSTGVNSGSGFIIKDHAVAGHTSVIFSNNFLGNVPDTLFTVPQNVYGECNFQGTLSYAAANRTPDITQNASVFTNSGTFTVPIGVSSVKARVVGGGGGGGGATATNNGGGGSAGGYSEKYLTGLAQGGTLAVTIGAGGAGGSGTGTAGGNTTVGSDTITISTITANGGAGGFSTGATSPGGAGAALGSGGDVNEGGSSGGMGTGGLGGQGGGSVFGGGAANAGAGGNAGNNGVSHGAGGGGASSGSNHNGGAGVGGIVILEWQI